MLSTAETDAEGITFAKVYAGGERAVLVHKEGRFAIGGFGAFAMAIGMSWFFVSDGRPEFLAIPLWGVFLFWQFFPVMATARLRQ